MQHFFPRSGSGTARKRRRGGGLSNIDVIFGDHPVIAALPGHHWEESLIPHLFSLGRQDVVIAHTGWSLVRQNFRHSDLGGSTTGMFELGLLVPTSCFQHTSCPPPLVKQPWAPLETVINDVESAQPLSPFLEERLRTLPLTIQGATPVINVSKLLHSRGLAPPVREAARLRVIVGCVFNSSRLGVRRLTVSELGALADVPILLLDYLRSRAGEEGKGLTRRLYEGHPSKVLFMGGDYLLSVFVRGGMLEAKAPGSSNQFSRRFSHLLEVQKAHKMSRGEGDIKEGDVKKGGMVDTELQKMAAGVSSKEGQKEDDSPVHVHLWDGNFLRLGYKEGALDTHAVRGVKVDPREVLRVLPAGDLRDCALSDTQLMSEMQLPRWRWSLFKIRAAALRYWRWKVTHSFVLYLRSRRQRGNVVNSRTWLRLGSRWIRKRKRNEDSKQEHFFQWKGYTQGMRKGESEGEVLYRKFWEEQRRGINEDSRRDTARTVEVGRDCIRRASNALWWDWAVGSALLFWNWPESHVVWARDGQPHYTTGEMPSFKRPQKPARTDEMMEKMRSKVNKVRKRGYIEAGGVCSLTHMFAVPKGITDIRMVYDGTSSGLNKVVWAPHFGLPTLFNTLRGLLPGYYQADLDVGEMFLCFPLGAEMRPYAGVDVTLINENVNEPAAWREGRTRSWERWGRNFMGLRDSPYRSMQMMLMAKYVAYGDRLDPLNPFAWEKVILNLPGSEGYDPSFPWVMKVRGDGHLACEVFIYVDDGRITGWTRAECWRAARRLSSVLSHLGLQDAYRKRTEALTSQGAWAGGISLTEAEWVSEGGETRRGVAITVTQAKWDKASSLVSEIAEMMEENAAGMPRHRLEQIRGFLIYVARTYRWLNPYLKGLHLSIDGWRSDRDEEGYRRKVGKADWRDNKGKDEEEEEDEDREPGSFRMDESAMKQAEKDMEEGREVDLEAFRVRSKVKENEVPPQVVKAVPRLMGDVEMLLELFGGAEPAVQRARVTTVAVALYLMGDASGVGFGSALWDESGVAFEAGNWKQQWKEESSNFREASNLTARIEKLGEEGKLNDRELFVLTDNATYEGTFYKGHSKTSPKLTELIRRLRMVERKYGCTIHVLHIAGTRMKISGVDGLSRGDFLEGIMSGMNPWKTIPLDLSANERSKGRVETWVRSWWFDKDGMPWSRIGEDTRTFESSQLITLTPEDWFGLRDIKGHRLWLAPPAAMETVMELFDEDRIVNPHLAHVFVIPRLMTHLWRKKLFRDADLRFYVRAGVPFWPSSMHEPLTVVVVLPLAHVENYRGPWIVKHRPQTGAFGERLDAEFGRPRDHGRKEFSDLDEPMPSLWEGDYQRAAYCGDCYRRYEDDPLPIQRTMDEEDDEEVGFETEESRDSRFMCARNGDHVMGLPFECDLCHFRNVAKREVDWDDVQDLNTLVFIRAATLDAMWSKESGTVLSNFSRMSLDLENALGRLSIDGIFPRMGNPEMEDKVGMAMALITLDVSTRPGVYADHLQWDTMRQTPTWFFHAYEAIMGGADGSVYAGDAKKMYETSCVTRSRWFAGFLLGAKRRMGVKRKQNEALTSKQLLGLLAIAEEEWIRTNDEEVRKRLEEVASFTCIGFCASLRGEEISLTSIMGMLQFWDSSQGYHIPHLMITLRGKYKGEQNLRWHMLAIAEVTKSGIQVRKWVERLMHTRVEREGAKTGPLFANAEGNRVSLNAYEGEFRRLLTEARKKDPKIFPPKAEIDDYSLRRSLRRGATTQATNNKVSGTTIQLVNRWRQREAARGAEPGLSMQQVYTDALSAIDRTLCFSQSL